MVHYAGAGLQTITSARRDWEGYSIIGRRGEEAYKPPLEGRGTGHGEASAGLV